MKAFQDTLGDRAAEILDACTKCGRCFAACPMVPPAGLATADGPEVVAGILDLLAGGAGTADAVRWTQVCSSSGRCIPACDYGVNPRFMVKLAGLRAKQADPPVATRRALTMYNGMAQGVRQLSRLLLSPEELARLDGARGPNADDDPVDIVFYTGCNVLKTPHIALHCLDVLDALGLRYAVEGGPNACCGIVHFMGGDATLSGRLGYHTIERLAARRTAEVLSWCPSCQAQIGEGTLPSYERSTGTKPFDLVPFIVFLDRHLARLRPLFAHAVNRRVAIHERPGIAGVMEAAKRILAAIPGVELIEIDVPRVGLMSNFMSGLPAFKRELLKTEFAHVEASRADTLATIFHSCHREICHFDSGRSFEIVNIMDLIGEAMGFRHEDGFKRLKAMRDVDSIILDNLDVIRDRGLDVDGVRAAFLTEFCAPGVEVDGGLSPSA
jgi:Fe-S oxidoreductase